MRKEKEKDKLRLKQLVIFFKNGLASFQNEIGSRGFSHHLRTVVHHHEREFKLCFTFYTMSITNCENL